MVPKDTQDRTVKTTETVFMIIEYLQANDGARLRDLAEEFDLAKSTLHRHLTTLAEREYVVKEDGYYWIGARFIDLGQHARSRQPAFEMAKSVVDEIAEETGERAQFIIEEHGWAVYIHRTRGSNAVRTDPGIGKRIHMHLTSAGKSILSQYPRERVEAIIEQRGLSGATPNSITTEAALFEELSEIRDRGYSLNNQENIDGLRAVGVPIRGTDDEVIGALSVAGPTRRLKGSRYTEELPDYLLGIANELELNIAYS
jgi:DNA-binding IclR family transcriptional regulator